MILIKVGNKKDGIVRVFFVVIFIIIKECVIIIVRIIKMFKKISC